MKKKTEKLSCVKNVVHKQGRNFRKFFGVQATSIKTKAARNKFPRKESTPETEDCEC